MSLKFYSHSFIESIESNASKQTEQNRQSKKKKRKLFILVNYNIGWLSPLYRQNKQTAKQKHIDHIDIGNIPRYHIPWLVVNKKMKIVMLISFSYSYFICFGFLIFVFRLLFRLWKRKYMAIGIDGNISLVQSIFIHCQSLNLPLFLFFRWLKIDIVVQ